MLGTCASLSHSEISFLDIKSSIHIFLKKRPATLLRTMNMEKITTLSCLSQAKPLIRASTILGQRFCLDLQGQWQYLGEPLSSGKLESLVYPCTGP